MNGHEFFLTSIVLLFLGIRGDVLSSQSLNDLSVEKCKDQIFLLNIFGKYNKKRDFKHMLLLKVIYSQRTKHNRYIYHSVGFNPTHWCWTEYCKQQLVVEITAGC